MHRDEAAVMLARQASETLAEMLEHTRAQPADADRFDWSSDALDELARAVVTLGEIVESSTAQPRADTDGEGIVEATRELATAIVRRRNSLLTENSAVRRRRSGGLPVQHAG